MQTAKLVRHGNSTGLTLGKDVLQAAGLERGDTVTILVEDGSLRIVKSDGDYARSMEVGRAFAQRYRRTMRDLAK